MDGYELPYVFWDLNPDLLGKKFNLWAISPAQDTEFFLKSNIINRIKEFKKLKKNKTTEWT